MLTIVTLIFGMKRMKQRRKEKKESNIINAGGAGVFYGIEGKNEEEESETGDIITWKYLNCVYHNNYYILNNTIKCYYYYYYI